MDASSILSIVATVVEPSTLDVVLTHVAPFAGAWLGARSQTRATERLLRAHMAHGVPPAHTPVNVANGEAHA